MNAQMTSASPLPDVPTPRTRPTAKTEMPVQAPTHASTDHALLAAQPPVMMGMHARMMGATQSQDVPILPTHQLATMAVCVPLATHVSTAYANQGVLPWIVTMEMYAQTTVVTHSVDVAGPTTQPLAVMAMPVPAVRLAPAAPVRVEARSLVMTGTRAQPIHAMLVRVAHSPIYLPAHHVTMVKALRSTTPVTYQESAVVRSTKLVMKKPATEAAGTYAETTLREPGSPNAKVGVQPTTHS
jgi:hypothetical protein